MNDETTMSNADERSNLEGLSDEESFVDLNENSKAVVVELPSTFAESNGADSDTSSLSFVQNLNQLTLGSSATTSSWSHVRDDVQSLSTWNTSTAGQDNDAASTSGLSSVVSNFDVLSIGGSVKRRCKICSYLNEDQAGICDVCGIALVANPCLDIDTQIALHLQQQEEQLSFAALVQEERKRKSMSQQPLLVQAQMLAVDIVHFCERHTYTGIEAMPEMDLVPQGARFIEYAKSTGFRVTLAYHFSRKMDVGDSSQRIRTQGLHNQATVSNNIDGALEHCRNPLAVGRHRRRLAAIPEDSEAEAQLEANYLGWIVAIAVDDADVAQSSVEVPVSSGSALVYTVTTEQSLPLVSFDASIRKHDIFRILLNGFQQIVADWPLTGIDNGVRTVADYSDGASPTKKRRSTSTESLNKSMDQVHISTKDGIALNGTTKQETTTSSDPSGTIRTHQDASSSAGTFRDLSSQAYDWDVAKELDQETDNAGWHYGKEYSEEEEEDADGAEPSGTSSSGEWSYETSGDEDEDGDDPTDSASSETSSSDDSSSAAIAAEDEEDDDDDEGFTFLPAPREG